jgi:transcriptional regulator with XRE-family HTH domain
VTITNSELCLAFGAAVRRLRLDRGLSQEDFGDLVEMHRTFVGGIERGERNPTLVTIARLARGLDISPADLLSAAGTDQRRK